MVLNLFPIFDTDMKTVCFTLFSVFFSFQMLAQTAFEKGKKLYEQHDFEGAKQQFEHYLEQNPKSYKTIEYIGDCHAQLSQWNEAIAQYQSLKDKFPANANYWYKYGGAMAMKAKNINKFRALLLVGKIENAFLTVAKLDTKHIDTRWALVILYIELPGIVGGSEKKAQKYADELMQLSKVDGYLAQGYINEYYKRYDKAEQSYIKAHEIGNSKTTFQKLYNLYLNKINDKEKAKRLKDKFEK